MHNSTPEFIFKTFQAYPPEFHAIETVMRMSAVKRWHMIETSRTQTLAEHSANVALLAMAIAKNAPINYFDSYVEVALAALVHDVPEAFTGDIPTPTKRHLTGVDELEHALTDPTFKYYGNDNTHALIKMCDLADGIRFIRVHGLDMTGGHAQKGLEAQLATKIEFVETELGWPEHLAAHVVNMLDFYAYEGV